MEYNVQCLLGKMTSSISIHNTTAVCSENSGSAATKKRLSGSKDKCWNNLLRDTRFMSVLHTWLCNQIKTANKMYLSLVWPYMKKLVCATMPATFASSR